MDQTEIILNRLFRSGRNLQSMFAGTLPGFQTQIEMSPAPRPGTRPVNEVHDCFQAAVLLLHYLHDDRPVLVLTVRSLKVSLHQGQIAFPGGRVETGESARMAACRETREELGVTVTDSHIAGALTPLYIPPSHYCIHPFVACRTCRPRLIPEPGEVERILEIPLMHFMVPANRFQETWKIAGQPVQVPFYRYRNHIIWGATAMVLAEWVAVLQDQISRDRFI